MTIFLLFFGLIACSNTTANPDKARKTTTISTSIDNEIDSPAVNQSGKTVQVTNRVKEDIIATHKEVGKKPEQVIALWIEAAIRAQNNEKGAMEALAYLSVTHKKNKRWLNEEHFLKKIRKNKPCFRSLVVGATPENDYKVDVDNIKIKVRNDNSHSSFGDKWFVHSSGADTPRPVHLQKYSVDGLYYVNNFSSLHVDVRPASSNVETFQ